ncbi:glutamate-5-semialdehyde dehydrogenase [Alphaproteobacteria bacterium]|nr:glutamate-5-semialdehyde dehydrogenase [Alphaproteobacteria bacterium]
MKLIEKKVNAICEKAKKAAIELANTSNSERNKALQLISNNIIKFKSKIILANKKDISFAKKVKTPNHLLDRLLLDNDRINNMAIDVKNISKLPNPLGKILSKSRRPNGLKISKVSVPLGVIAVIFESRPNVASDVASLCLKSGNSVILKGGKEAKYSTEIIIKIIKDSLKITKINTNAISSLEDYSRDAVNQLFKMDNYIDVLVPRGGKELIKNVREKSNIPVFSHLDGICHTYIDERVDKEMAINIPINAKMRRTSICGATETILCHKNIVKTILPKLLSALIKLGCEIRGDEYVCKINKKVKKANRLDWSTEYLSAVVSIKIVKNIEEAIKHINVYSSKHTDAILTTDKKKAALFLREVESAIVMHNTSTQFADGAEFGLGAEIGISTGKLHARGPVSTTELTTYKYLVEGNGQLRK